MKKIFTAVTAAVLMIGLAFPIYATEATTTTSTIFVNGIEVKVSAYNIGGYNYFKLRDVAYMLNGTEKQFNVTYNGALNSIVLTSRQSYTPCGGELEPKETETKDASATSSKIIKDGVETKMNAYNIDGNNYFKLRELGEQFDFDVDYDEKTNSVKLNTKVESNKDKQVDEYGYRTDLFTVEPLPTPNPGPSHGKLHIG